MGRKKHKKRLRTKSTKQIDVQSDIPEIECCFIPQRQYLILEEKEGDRTKPGRYHGSLFRTIPGCGVNRFVVYARIEIKERIAKNLTEAQLAQSCLKYLNKPSKQKTKKKPRLPYGNLEVYSSEFDSKKGYLSVLLVTDDINNKNWWGKGKRF